MTLFARLFEVTLTTGLKVPSPILDKPIKPLVQPSQSMVAKAPRPNKGTAGYNFGKPLVIQKRV